MQDFRGATLTSGEIGSLWTTYIGETMFSIVYQHFMQHCDDPEIKQLLDMGSRVTDQLIKQIREIYKDDRMKLPVGFGEQDINLEAPRMFSDKFYMFYLKEAARSAIHNYSACLVGCHREDIREFFSSAIKEYLEVFNKVMDLMLSKGIVIRTPSIPIPKEGTTVHNQSFLGSWIGPKRPISSEEIKAIYVNLDTNMLGKSLMIAFSQSCRNEKIKNYLVKGRKISHKHIEIFINLLTDEDLPAPQLWDPEVTESNIPPFSDKLMMYHTGLAAGAGIENYGMAISKSARKDIAADFVRLAIESAQFAQDGAQLSINLGFLEQIPLAANRDHLASHPQNQY
ncbi:DUF3231 family protein [Mangrovibacillus cuniculi]|uniref:DUF3231 family protein n=1 Tax=Mangrovibacillus cuniculi TaxID=2593652 RepID=A0A7S8CAS2_9BACI|nr:DUF3231 family protein [Mangrovibacillus cuniculi]QPC46546.1 DUF3231 family protein [Mangrovibacillus cuniculi]